MTNDCFPCLCFLHCKAFPSAREKLNRSLLQCWCTQESKPLTIFHRIFWVPIPSSDASTSKHNTTRHIFRVEFSEQKHTHRPQMAIYGGTWDQRIFERFATMNITSPKRDLKMLLKLGLDVQPHKLLSNPVIHCGITLDCEELGDGV